MDILTDTHKEILKTYILNRYKAEHVKAVELFKGNDFKRMNDNTFIRSSCQSVDLADELTIQDIQEAYDLFVSGLKANQKLKSYYIYSYVSGECGCNSESPLAMDFIIYTLSDNIESKTNCTFKHTLRDFEFKYIHQRNGKDTLKHLKLFKRLGIDIEEGV